MKQILLLSGLNDRREVQLVRREDGALGTRCAGNAPLKPLFVNLGAVTELLLGVDGGGSFQVKRADLVVNLIGNGDANQRALAEADALLEAMGPVPVINKPKCVFGTGRHAISQTGADIPGLLTPPVALARPRRLREIEALWRAEQIPPQFLIRPLTKHGGKSLLRVLSEADLGELEQFAFDGQVFGISPFIDYRSADGYYRKYRLVFIDGVAYPRHLICHTDWMVHSESRQSLMTTRTDLQAEEQRFLNDPRGVLGEAAWAGLHELARRTKLEFVGVDFSLLPDGRALLFECNPCMNVLGAGAGASFAYLRPVVERIRMALMAMVKKRLHLK